MTTVRIVRASTRAGTWLARTDGDMLTPIAEDPGRAGVDPLRLLLADGLDPMTAPAVADATPFADAQLLAPVVAPQKVLAIGLNYADHARESGQDPPPAPITFVKTPNSIVGPGDVIRYRTADSTQVDYEAELALVIGRSTRDVSVGTALSYLLGYTVCNDVSARDAQFGDGQWIRGKSFDTFCPLGPWIVPAAEVPDPQTLPIRCRVNGQVLQDSNTSEMIFSCAELVSYLSRFMTLEPGDVIATGTPHGVGFTRTPPIFLLDGDTVEVEVDGVGTLVNTVAVS